VSGKRNKKLRKKVYGDLVTGPEGRNYNKEGPLQIVGKKFVRKGSVEADALRQEYQEEKRKWKERRSGS